jgi:hypothetical protein
LAHTRQAGNLKYIKSGNSYLYFKDSFEQLKKENIIELPAAETKFILDAS